MEIEEIKRILQEDIQGYWSPGDSDFGIEYVAEEDMDEGRWTDLVMSVIKADDELYGYMWYRGRSEYLDDVFPWEVGDWELFRVGTREVTVTEYYRM